jgi:hypothetical protein
MFNPPLIHLLGGVFIEKCNLFEYRSVVSKYSTLQSLNSHRLLLL